jgi:hypothetical protein
MKSLRTVSPLVPQTMQPLWPRHRAGQRTGNSSHDELLILCDQLFDVFDFNSHFFMDVCIIVSVFHDNGYC